MSSEVGVAYVRLLPSGKGFGAEAAKEIGPELGSVSESEGKKAGKRLGDGIATGLQDAGRKISGVGDKLTLGVTAPLVGIGVTAFAASKKFNAGMANIATLIPGNTDRVAELKLGVQDMAVEVGKSTDDLSDGLYNVISAFGDSSDSLDILNINARAATAGLATTQDAIDLTSAVTKGYGDTSAEAIQQASDLALLTVRLGQTTFPELASSVGKVIPIANELNVSQEELFATMATFTGVTGSASEVATQMRASLQALMAPTTDGAAAIAAAGYESGQAAVEALGFEGALGLLTSAAEDSGKPLQSYIGQVEGQVLALGLAGEQADDYKAKLGEMANAVGTTDEAFAEVTEGVNAAGFQWEQAKVQGEVLMQQLGDGLAPAVLSVFEAVGPLIGRVSELATKFAEMDPAQQKMIVGAVGIVAAVGPVLSIGGRVITMVGGMVKGFMGFVKIAKFVALGIKAIGLAITANPLGLLIAGIVLVVAGLVLLYKNSETFRNIVQGALRAVGKAAKWLWEKAIQPAWKGIKAAFDVVAKVVVWWYKNVIAPQFRAVVAVAKWLWGQVRSRFDTAKAVFDLVRRRVVELYNAWRQRLTAIRDRAKWLWDQVRARFRAAKGIFDNVVGWVRDMYTRAKGRFDDLVGFVKGLPGRIRDGLSSLRERLLAPFRAAFNAVARAWNNTVGNLSVSVPDWVPGLGGKGWSMPSIPTAAKGGVFEPARGGVLGVLAEAGVREYALPEPDLDALLAKAIRAGDGASAPAPEPGGRGGVVVQRMEVQAWSDRFSLSQIERELAMHGAV